MERKFLIFQLDNSVSRVIYIYRKRFVETFLQINMKQEKCFQMYSKISMKNFCRRDFTKI